MKNKKLALTLALAIPSFSFAQSDIYTPVLDAIEQNNPQLAVAHSLFNATAAENQTGLSPENPQVEFGYLFGKASTGNRQDVKVTQSFDFPTVYSRKATLQKQRTNSAKLQVLAQRRDILLQAKELLIDLLYNNALANLCSLQTENRRQLLETYTELAKKGEATAVDISNVTLNKEMMELELASVQAEQQRLLDELQILNGGNPVQFTETEFPQQMLPADFNSWFSEIQHKNPDLLLLDSEIESGQSDISLARAENLPKFSIGYQGEFVADAPFQGVVVGLSIPLWENKNKVNAAKARHLAAVQASDYARSSYASKMQLLFNQAKKLEQIETRYNNSLQSNPLPSLLNKQLNYGQISLADYLTQMQELLQARRQLLDLQRQRALVLAKLNANM